MKTYTSITNRKHGLTMAVVGVLFIALTGISNNVFAHACKSGCCDFNPTTKTCSKCC